jgi:hypothetical protein
VHDDLLSAIRYDVHVLRWSLDVLVGNQELGELLDGALHRSLFTKLVWHLLVELDVLALGQHYRRLLLA